ncbi:MAG: hypothetical protein IJA12_04460 [Oscillospiraceae bacterium]|nr:hypothetical protein [Oscillospiraceae bacterium]
MKFRKILTVLLSVSMLACFSACDDESSYTAKKDDIVTETVAVDENEKAADEAYEEVQEQISEAELERLEQEQAYLEEEQQAQVQAEDEAAAALAEDIMAGYDAENPQETVMSIFESAFATSFGENMEVSYDEAESNYIISVWQDGFAEALETEQGKTALEATSSTLETSLQTMTEQIRLMDAKANITFNFVSDLDQEEVLLSIYNGEITYSVIE